MRTYHYRTIHNNHIKFTTTTAKLIAKIIQKNLDCNKKISPVLVTSVLRRACNDRERGNLDCNRYHHHHHRHRHNRHHHHHHRHRHRHHRHNHHHHHHHNHHHLHDPDLDVSGLVEQFSKSSDFFNDTAQLPLP